MRWSRAIVPVVLLAVGSTTGCGGTRGGDDGATAAAQSPPSSSSSYVAPDALATQVGNGVRKGLYRIAVMSQTDDDAKDLGQPLSTGTLSGVSCTPRGARPSGGAAWPWTCVARWRGVDRRARRVHYAVRVAPTGCFSAGAVPERHVRYDATIHSYAEDPLNTLVSVRRGC